ERLRCAQPAVRPRVIGKCAIDLRDGRIDLRVARTGVARHDDGDVLGLRLAVQPRLRDGRVGGELRFNPLGVDIAAERRDEAIRAPSFQDEKTVVEATEIAGRKPFVLRSPLTEIAEHLRPAYEHLTVVGEPDLRMLERATDAADASARRSVQTDYRRTFGEAVAFVHG